MSRNGIDSQSEWRGSFENGNEVYSSTFRHTHARKTADSETVRTKFSKRPARPPFNSFHRTIMRLQTKADEVGNLIYSPRPDFPIRNVLMF